MMSKNVVNASTERENLFRMFQIEKFNRNKSVPGVSMTVDINLRMLQEFRNAYNKTKQKTDSITLTHALIKAVAIVLTDFPMLYGFFDGRKIVLSDKLKINLPVSEGNHVEYVVIESPEIKSLPDIASEVREEVEKIRSGNGTFYLILKKLFSLPKLIRSIITNAPFIYLKNTYKNYGNFPITNFGSFGVKNGIPIISAPIISALCLGMIQNGKNENAENSRTTELVMPVTLVFDHRPIDGAYSGKFLKSLKDCFVSKICEPFPAREVCQVHDITRFP